MAQTPNLNPQPTVHAFAIDPAELDKLRLASVDGSGESALRLARHYLLTQNNRKDALYWAVISAENGDVDGQYFAGFLLKDDSSALERRRAVYWLRKAAGSGSTLAKELLAEVLR